MTERHEQVVAWMSELEADPRYQIEEAAAELALEVAELLGHALDARPDVSQKDLAARLGVDPSRVSQVLNGDGNLRVATVAKYLRALGYVVRLRPQSVEGEAPSLIRETRRPVVAHLYKTVMADKSGTYERVSVAVTSNSEPAEPLERPRHIGSVNLSAPKRSYVSTITTNVEERERVDA